MYGLHTYISYKHHYYYHTCELVGGHQASPELEEGSDCLVLAGLKLCVYNSVIDVVLYIVLYDMLCEVPV